MQLVLLGTVLQASASRSGDRLVRRGLGTYTTSKNDLYGYMRPYKLAKDWLGAKPARRGAERLGGRAPSVGSLKTPQDAIFFFINPTLAHRRHARARAVALVAIINNGGGRRLRRRERDLLVERLVRLQGPAADEEAACVNDPSRRARDS